MQFVTLCLSKLPIHSVLCFYWPFAVWKLVQWIDNSLGKWVLIPSFGVDDATCKQLTTCLLHGSFYFLSFFGSQLTASHLILSQYIPDSSVSGTTGLSSGSGPLALVTPTLSRQSRVQAVTTIFELPLTAICHVRPINSCDLYHQPTEDVPRIFQLIYDRPSSNDSPAPNGMSSNSGKERIIRVAERSFLFLGLFHLVL